MPLSPSAASLRAGAFSRICAAASHMSEGKAFSFLCHHLGMPRSAWGAQSVAAEVCSQHKGRGSKGQAPCLQASIKNILRGIFSPQVKANNCRAQKAHCSSRSWFNGIWGLLCESGMEVDELTGVQVSQGSLEGLHSSKTEQGWLSTMGVQT